MLQYRYPVAARCSPCRSWTENALTGWLKPFQFLLAQAVKDERQAFAGTVSATDPWTTTPSGGGQLLQALRKHHAGSGDGVVRDDHLSQADPDPHSGVA